MKFVNFKVINYAGVELHGRQVLLLYDSTCKTRFIARKLFTQYRTVKFNSDIKLKKE